MYLYKTSVGHASEIITKCVSYVIREQTRQLMVVSALLFCFGHFVSKVQYVIKLRIPISRPRCYVDGGRKIQVKGSTFWFLTLGFLSRAQWLPNLVRQKRLQMGHLQLMIVQKLSQ